MAPSSFDVLRYKLKLFNEHTYSSSYNDEDVNNVDYEQYIDVADKLLQFEDKINSNDLITIYDVLEKVYLDVPYNELKKTFQKALKSEKNDNYSFHSSLELLNKGVINLEPEEEISLMKDIVESNKCKHSNYQLVCSVLKSYVNYYPEDILDIASKIIKNGAEHEDNINKYGLTETLKILENLISKKNPEFTDNIYETLKEALKSDKNSPESMIVSFLILSKIVTNKPQLAEQVFNTVAENISSDKNDANSVNNAYFTFATIVEQRPDLANKVFDFYNNLIKSEPKDSYTLNYVYSSLLLIWEKCPQYEDQIFNMIRESAKLNKSNLKALKSSCSVLTTIAKSHPHKVKQILDIVKFDIEYNKNCNYDLDPIYPLLYNIVERWPETSNQVIDIIKETVQKNKSKKNITTASVILAEITEFKPELAKQCFDIIKDTFPNENDYNSFHDQYFILSKCMKSKDAKEFIEKATKHKSDLKACYSMRFSTRNECRYLIDNYSLGKIADMNLSAQHRCTNILVSQLAKEHHLDANKALDYRTNPNNMLYKDNTDWLTPASINAANVFGCWFPSYIKQTQPYLSTHDSVYWLPKDMGPRKNASFVSFVQRNLIYDINGKKKRRPLAEMEIIANHWATLLPEDEKLKYKDILAICKSEQYRNIEHRDFAVEANKWGVHSFQYKDFEDIYAAGLDVPEPFDSSKRFQFGKYCGRFLPRDDVRVGFFGQYTDCCQHFVGAGRECAISSIKDPYSQLFVIEDENGKIVAGSWVWENTEPNIDIHMRRPTTSKTYRDVCFDNIEAIGEFNNHPMLNKIYRMAGRYLTEEANCRKVTIGMGYQDADTSQYAKTTTIDLPRQYNNGYTDARYSQVLLYENPNAAPLDKSKESIRFVRKACLLDRDKMEQISEQCFPEGDQRLQTPDRLTGLALVDADKGVVGYCLYDKDEKSIYDMAVLPEYRTDQNASSTKLFTALFKEIQKMGGTWTAELRDSTTYRYIQAMQKRGVVSFETTGIDHTMSDGSKVYTVSFKVNDNKTNSKLLSAQSQNE